MDMYSDINCKLSSNYMDDFSRRNHKPSPTEFLAIFISFSEIYTARKKKVTMVFKSAEIYRMEAEVPYKYYYVGLLTRPNSPPLPVYRLIKLSTSANQIAFTSFVYTHFYHCTRSFNQNFHD